jgi:hypothetical protein
VNRAVNTDIIAGVIGLVISAVFYFEIGEVSWMSIIFPETIIYITTAISIILMVKGFVKPTRLTIFKDGSNVRWLVTGILFFAWVLLMPVLGFFVSTTLFITLIVSYLARSRERLTLSKYLVWMPIILAEVGFFYLIFSKLLHVPLPEGYLI